MNGPWRNIDWYMHNQFNEFEIERYCIMTVDGGMRDDRALKIIREMRLERLKNRKLETVASFQKR